jgi:N-acyl-D-amino-acid deacylase
MFDILIQGGTVIDGTGAPALRCDVGVTRDTIAAVGMLQDAQAREVIDARGLHICPGFIDMHGHSDFNMLVQPPGRGKIMQGITTEVMGNCGLSAAPLLGAAREQRKKSILNLGAELCWTHLDEFADAVKGIKLACHMAPLIGHGNIRGSIIGYGSRQPAPDDMLAMQQLLVRQMEAGAWGLSTGLVYPPGMYAAPDETAGLAKIAARFGGIYTSHMRSEGDRLLESIEETLAVGRSAGIPVQISHLKTQGKRNWHKLPAAFELIEKARSGGMAVFADRYPYTASSTGLDVVFPGWACEGGSAAELERLQSPAMRDRIYADILESMTEAELARDILIAKVITEKNKPLEGLRLGQAADLRGQSVQTALFSILMEEELDVDAVFFSMCEDNLRDILRKSYVMLGSDASVWDTEGVLGAGKPHPRAFGSFPRLLRKYVLEQKLFSLEEAVYKMTGLPASAIGLSERGVIGQGLKADLVLLRLPEVQDRADYADPHRFPAGISRVMVEGIWGVIEGQSTGKYAGRLLLKKQP